MHKMKTELEIRDIMKNTNDFNTLCRICLTGDITKSTSLFDAGGKMSICERIMLCTNVQIQNDESLPNKICDNCSGELQTADNFRIKCEHSDALLKKFVYNNNVADIKEEDIKEEDYFPLKYDDGTANTSEVDDSANEDSVLESTLDDKTANICSSKLLRNAAKSVQKSKRSVDDRTESRMKGKFPCSFCKKALSTKYSLNKHLASMHKNESMGSNVKMYNCSECTYSTPRSYTLMYHMYIHTGEKPYKCETCERCFAQPSSLYSHRKSHSSKMHFTCSECGKQFKHKFIYENHKNVHSDIKKFTCSICSKGLRSQQTLYDHMNRHYNIKNFSCEICGSSFVARVELISHKKKHSGEKRFQCNICEYRCNVKRSLETHMMRHSGQRAFKCEMCELACYTRVELKLHMRKHTKEKNYSCPVCHIKFSRSTGVNRHMLYTHGIQYKINDTTDRRMIK